MPTLFSSRRHAPPVQPLTRETANPNAATAAASAFGRRGSNASLSSAAAAAALRARPVTPTNVAEVQTKRTHRRSPSLSSQTSRDRAPARELQRTPSVGSMIERTFRSPSPGRSPAPRDASVPPVPSLPSNADDKMNGGQRKGAAVQTQPFRTASEKMRDGQHGSWFGGATAGDPANVRRSDVSQSAAAVQEPRPGSVSPSINFSYPRAKVQSSAASVDDQTPVYDANSRRMVPRSELLARSQSMHESSGNPKKKKPEVARSGSHLSRGTVGKTQSPALEHPPSLSAEQTSAVAPESQAPGVSEQPREPSKQKKKKKQQSESPKPVPIGKQATSRDTGSSADDSKPPLSTMPSVVSDKTEREEPEREASGPSGAQQPAPPLEPVTGVTTDKGAKAIAANGQTQSPEAVRPGGSARFAREHSESPARSARFAPAPDQLLVRHEPPPRSVSPKKSAMKLSSQRDASFSDDESEMSEPRQCPHGQDDVVARKKSVRVSWDDNSTVVVGESVQPHDTESPFVPSPQAKKPWHSIVTKYTKKDSVNLSEDETMSPRPALPLFGSVREKKSREYEERRLVRPSERTRSPSAPEPTETNAGTGASQSSDAAVGAALSQEQASRNAANISKYREPLPVSMPHGESSAKESTFVESSSDDDLDTDVTTEPEDATEPTSSKLPVPRTPEREPAAGAVEADAPEAKRQGEGVPTISVSLPSPGLEKPKRSDYLGEAPEIPGRFPDDDDFADGGHVPDMDTQVEPISQSTVASTTMRSLETPSAASNTAMEDIEEEEEESDRYSIYSDAYEDLDEVEGDGFLSLDAVVESSTDTKTPMGSREQAATKVLDDPQKRAGSPGLSTRDSASPQPAKDWENAKAYWRSLSAAQRRLLEVEALSDDSDDEADDRPRRAKEDGERQATTSHSKGTSEPCQERNERSYQIKPGTKWSDDAANARRTSAPAGQSGKAVPKIRHSMRGEQPGSARTGNEQQPGGMRKSMRSGGPAPATAPAGDGRRSRRPEMDTDAGVGMRKSLRDRRGDGAARAARPSLSQTDRPASYHPPETAKPLKARKRNLSVEDLGARGNMKPSLRRRGSDDSASSFTRSRASPGAAHGFRMSMRASLQEPSSTPAAAKPSGRFSLRSMSPPAFRRNSVTSLPGTPTSRGGAGGRLRSSMRGEATSTGPRTRLSPFKRSPGGRKGGGGKGKGGSRFADSSDEDEAGPSFFSSRFADSSDEEDIPRPQPKGKGMARSLRGANTSASMAAPASAGGTSASQGVASPDPVHRNGATAQSKRATLGVEPASSLHRSGSGRGTLTPLPAAQGGGAARPRQRRGSIISILRRKREPSRISRDARPEPPPDELSEAGSDGHHKRGPSWPLPDAEAGPGTAQQARHGIAADKTRPSTAGGPVSASKAMTTAFHRRNTSLGTSALGGGGGGADADDDGERGGADAPPPLQQLKKKKFGALRKMFGIHN